MASDKHPLLTNVMCGQCFSAHVTDYMIQGGFQGSEGILDVDHHFG